MNNIKKYISDLTNNKDLSQKDSIDAFNIIMSGKASNSQIGAFLASLKTKGETINEILGGAIVLRNNMEIIDSKFETIDIVGTGGDAKGTFNISTTSAIITAACGIPVAKHGNKAVSSKSGAADVLEKLGVNINISTEKIKQCLDRINITFLNAPNHHPTMKNVAPIRSELGIRTIFNILGPLANPARVKVQLTGVYSKDWVEPIANVLKKLNFRSAWVVYGMDGMDEITTTEATYVNELKDGNINKFFIKPEEYGIQRSNPSDLIGGDPSDNAKSLVNLLKGVKSPYRDIVLLNTAASLKISGKAKSIEEGIKIAQNVIDSGKALSCLEQLIEFTNK
ncbi:MAG: Anthranilate phosphoribosyltransferase [Alphaproteobacteria bacterium MarineAlpha2_Bin1]|nr:MAG: Anthranilate phosphoribosyltransferase [Alphaproteobacteria bacterium MarineAlpha2_Bin1]|tara:strand:- start:1802 stop:2815 length:1014 start_codon:yes stop_codon:yes gene_type:complete